MRITETENKKTEAEKLILYFCSFEVQLYLL